MPRNNNHHRQISKHTGARYRARLVFLLIVAACSASCAHYRVTELERFSTDPAHTTPEIITYAVTRNNMIIPEYVIDRKGNYPTSREEALQRFNTRRAELDDFVRNKYLIEPNTPYTIKRTLYITGELVVSPVVLIVTAASDLFFPNHHAETPSMTTQYLKAIFEEPIPEKPVLRDPLAVV